MAEATLRRQAFNGVMWRILETGGTHVIQFVISVVLARLVAPEQFASIAMLAVFTSVAGVFINSGFATALMRKVDRTQADCCTVFYFNIVVSLISYVVLFAIAPLVARFFDLPILTPLLRMTSVTLVIGSFGGVHRTLLGADMRFKDLAKCNVLALLISGCVGMYMAYEGYQVWALVAQSIVSVSISTAYLWYLSKWRPTWTFSRQSLREFFDFGSKLLASGLLDTLYGNIYGIVIAKVFAKPDLAFYNRAYGLAGLTSSMPTGILQSVTFPTLCKLQNDDDRLREGYRNMIRVSSFVIFPLCLGVGAVSFPLVNVLYTDVWIFSATILQIVVFAGMWYPIHAINLNLLQVKGRSDLFLRLEIIKKIVGVGVLCATLPFGLLAMCYGGIASSLICLVINTHYTGRLLNLGLAEQMKDMWPSLVLAVTMYVCCKAASTALGDGIVSLSVSVALGIAIYGGGAYLLRFKELALLRNMRK